MDKGRRDEEDMVGGMGVWVWRRGVREYGTATWQAASSRALLGCLGRQVHPRVSAAVARGFGSWGSRVECTTLVGFILSQLGPLFISYASARGNAKECRTGILMLWYLLEVKALAAGPVIHHRHTRPRLRARLLNRHYLQGRSTSSSGVPAASAAARTKTWLRAEIEAWSRVLYGCVLNGVVWKRGYAVAGA